MSNELSIKGFFNRDAVKSKFQELLGEKSQGFMASVLQVTSQNHLLAKADPASVYTSAMMAATLDLPINQNLGFAWIVPYKNHKTGKFDAQFQMGWRGFVQLAQRTGQYAKINVVEVYESQFKSFNPLTEDLEADFSIVGEGPIVGYCGYFKLINGFEKTVFWTREQCENHGNKYSKSFKNGPWRDNFDAMAKKTVLKNMLSKWGILSIEMQDSIRVDQSVIIETDDGLEGTTIDTDYVDAKETELTEVNDETFEQIKTSIEMGMTTTVEINTQYDISEAQEKELMQIESNSKNGK